MFDVFHGFVAAAEKEILVELVEHEMNKRSRSPRAEFSSSWVFVPPVGAIIKMAHPFPSRSPMTERSETRRTRRRTSLRSLKSNSLRTVGRFGGH
jgi:hypothetical protein